MDEEVYSFMNYQSYQSGIETAHGINHFAGQRATNRTNLELKLCNSRGNIQGQ